MGQITVRIGGRGYALSCRDGEEDHLAALAAHLQSKADQLAGSLGSMSEPRLLLMAGILVADELFEARKAAAVAPPTVAATAEDEGRYAALVDRVEALADALEAEPTG
ncbi:MAG: cell division protein ZapA [Janthinobacterium lividum]